MSEYWIAANFPALPCSLDNTLVVKALKIALRMAALSIAPLAILVGTPASGETGPDLTQLTSVQLRSARTGTEPFTFATPIKDGLACGEIGIVTDATSSQVVTVRRWNSGCAKLVIVSGTQTLAANAASTIHIFTGTPAAVPNLSCIDIETAAPSASVDLGDGGVVKLPDLLATPWRAFLSGPEMAECHYKATTANGALIIFYVRLWKSGRIWIRVSVENGWFDQPHNVLHYTAAVVIGEVTVFRGALAHPPNTRWSVKGWIGDDPLVTPRHAAADIVATKLVPNYIDVGAASPTRLGRLYQNYAPFQTGNWTPHMGDPGYQDQIGLYPLWDALYITNRADPITYRSVLANADALNTYGIVWRVHADGDLPVRPSVVGNQNLGTYDLLRGNMSPPPAPAVSQIPGGALGATTYFLKLEYADYNRANSTDSAEVSFSVNAHSLLRIESPPASTMGNAAGYYVFVGTARGAETLQNRAPIALGAAWTEPASGLLSLGAPSNVNHSGNDWEIAHHGSGGVLAWMITGDYYYFETAAFQAATVWLTMQNGGESAYSLFNGSLMFGGQERAWAWELRTIAQLAAIAPDSDPVFPDYQKLLADNARFWTEQLPPKGRLAGGDIGQFYVYAPAPIPTYTEQDWEQDMIAASLGMAVEMEPIASLTDLARLARYVAKSPVGRTQSGADGSFCFNYAATNSTQIGPNTRGPSGIQAVVATQFTSWPAIYAASMADLPTEFSGGACTNMRRGSSGADPGNCVGFWGQYVPALAYAVDMGADGADAAWALLTGATNWKNSGFIDCPTSSAGLKGLNDAPQWGISPR
jgi:hypothetical protein